MFSIKKKKKRLSSGAPPLTHKYEGIFFYFFQDLYSLREKEILRVGLLLGPRHKSYSISFCAHCLPSVGSVDFFVAVASWALFTFWKDKEATKTFLEYRSYPCQSLESRPVSGLLNLLPDNSLESQGFSINLHPYHSAGMT